MTFPMTIVDTIFKALEKAVPHRTIAAHHADLLIGAINGISSKDGRFFLGMCGPMGGGWGAKLTEDGMSSTVCLNDGDTHNSPVEQMESKFPLLFERHALRQDSCGPGRYRGGLRHRGADPARRQERRRSAERQGADAAAEAGRRL